MWLIYKYWMPFLICTRIFLRKYFLIEINFCFVILLAWETMWGIFFFCFSTWECFLFGQWERQEHWTALVRVQGFQSPLGGNWKKKKKKSLILTLRNTLIFLVLITLCFFFFFQDLTTLKSGDEIQNESSTEFTSTVSIKSFKSSFW